MTDPITDMFNRIRNAQAVSKEKVYIPFSNFKFEIAKILKEEGFIKDIKKKRKNKKKALLIKLKYGSEGNPVFTKVNRISKPGQRIYKKASEVSLSKRGYGTSIISTSKGPMTAKNAKKQKIGGELICEIW